MPTVITKTSYLELNSVPLATPAWWITNLTTEMFKRGLKGGDTDVPHAPGGLANPRRLAINRKLFRLVIVGAYNKDGVAQSNVQSSIETNVDYLFANIGYAAASGDGTVPAVWHRFDGTTKAADVTVSLLEFDEIDKRPNINAALELTVPAGAFA